MASLVVAEARSAAMSQQKRHPFLGIAQLLAIEPQAIAHRAAGGHGEGVELPDGDLSPPLGVGLSGLGHLHKRWLVAESAPEGRRSSAECRMKNQPYAVVCNFYPFCIPHSEAVGLRYGESVHRSALPYGSRSTVSAVTDTDRRPPSASAEQGGVRLGVSPRRSPACSSSAAFLYFLPRSPSTNDFNLYFNSSKRTERKKERQTCPMWQL